VQGGDVRVVEACEQPAARFLGERAAVREALSAQISESHGTCPAVTRHRRSGDQSLAIEAKDDPRVVDEAIIGSCPANEVRATALLSNGASRLVDTFGLTGWAGLLHLLETDGPGEIIPSVMETEACDRITTDDATIVCHS
jgi:hypothetical protein